MAAVESARQDPRRSPAAVLRAVNSSTVYFQENKVPDAPQRAAIEVLRRSGWDGGISLQFQCCSPNARTTPIAMQLWEQSGPSPIIRLWVYGGTAAGFPYAGVWGGGNAIGVEGYSRYGNGVHGRSYSPSENHRLKGGGCSNGL